MRQRLQQRGFTSDEIETTMGRLEKADLLNDADFATEWVRSRHATSSRGQLALKRELRTKGIADDLAAEALSQIEPEDERASALALARKKLNVSGEDLHDHALRSKAYRRLAGALGRRGFPPDVIGSVVKEVLDEARATDRA